MRRAPGQGFPFAQLLLAVAVRASLLALALSGARGINATVTNDAGHDLTGYFALARSLLEHHSFGIDGIPELFRPPLYPLLLVPGIAIGSPAGWAVGLNMIASMGLVVAGWMLARRVAGPRAATIAAWLLAIEPTLIAWTLATQPDLLLAVTLTALTLAMTVAVSAPETRGEPRRWIVIGLLGVAAAFLKPVAYVGFFAIVLTPLVIPRWAWRRRIVAAVIVLLSAAPIAAWQLRNYALSGFGGFSTQLARAAALGVASSLQSREERRPFVDVKAERWAQGLRVGSTGRDLDARGVDALWQTAYETSRRSPIGVATVAATNAIGTAVLPSATWLLVASGLQGEESNLNVTALVVRGEIVGSLRRLPVTDRFRLAAQLAALTVQLAVLALAAVGLHHLGVRREVIPVWVMVAVYFVLGSGAFPDGRLRLPYVPFLLMAAGTAMAARARSDLDRSN